MDHLIQSMKQVYNKGDDFYRELINRLRREIEHGDLNEAEHKGLQSFVQDLENSLSTRSHGNSPVINMTINTNNINTVNNYAARQAGVGNTSEEEKCEYGKMMGEVR